MGWERELARLEAELGPWLDIDDPEDIRHDIRRFDPESKVTLAQIVMWMDAKEDSETFIIHRGLPDGD